MRHRRGPRFLSLGRAISKYPITPTIVGNSSILVFDSGIGVGRIVTVDYTSTGLAAIELAFTEAKN
jgi:hypothetical protein